MLERPESRERNVRGVRQDLKKIPSSPERMNPATCLPYIYFALFDGHAGTGAAVAAANQLHHILHVSTFHITL
jgi:serine/threonine protein phosphatase PrpC